MILLKRGWKLSLLLVLVFSLGIGGVKAQSISVVTSVVPANAKIGDKVTYTTVITSMTDTQINSLTLSIQANDGVEISSWDQVSKSKNTIGFIKTANGGTISKLVAGGALTLTYRGEIKENTSFTAACTATVTDAVGAAVSDGVAFDIDHLMLSITNTPDKMEANIGDEVTYETVIKSDSKQSLRLTITPNDGIKLSNATLKAASNNTKVDNLTIGGGTISFPVGGGTVTLTYKGEIQENTGMSAACEATIASRVSSFNESRVANTTIQAPTPVAIVTTANTSAANIGSDVVYTTVIKAGSKQSVLLVINANNGVTISQEIASNPSVGVVFTKEGNGGRINFPGGGGTITLTYNGKIVRYGSFIASFTTTITGANKASSVSVQIKRNVNLQISEHKILENAPGWNPTNGAIISYETTIINKGEDDMGDESAVFSTSAGGNDINLVKTTVSPASVITIASNGSSMIKFVGLKKNQSVTFKYQGKINGNDRTSFISNRAMVVLTGGSNTYNNDYNDEINNVYATWVDVKGVKQKGWISYRENEKSVGTYFKKDIDLYVTQHVDKQRAKDGEKVTYITTIGNNGMRPTSDGLGPITLTFKTTNVILANNAIENAIKGALQDRTDIAITTDYTQPNTYIINHIPADGKLTFSYIGHIHSPTGDPVSIYAEVVGKKKSELPKGNDHMPIIVTSSSQDQASTQVIRNINLKVINTVKNKSIPQPTGTMVTYTTVISNRGPAAVRGITLTFETDGVIIQPTIQGDHVDFSSNPRGSSIALAPGNSAGRQAYYINTTIESGKSITLTYTGKITSQSNDATNKATVTHSDKEAHDDIGTHLNDKTSTATTIIQKAIDLQIENRVTPPQAQINSTVNYQTVISNKGLNAVTGLSHALTFTIVTKGVTINDAGITTHPDNNGVIITKNATLSIGDKRVYVITNFPKIASGLTLKYTGTINTEALPEATNNVSIAASGVDFIEGNLSNNSSTATTLIIKKIDLSVKTTVAQPNPQLRGASLSYTTVITNVGLTNTVTNATLSIETNGVTINPNIYGITHTLGSSDKVIKFNYDKSTPSRHVYTISSLPVGGIITLTHEGKILPNSHSAVNRSTIASPEDLYHDIDPKKNVSVAQTLIKPILTQPLSITICPEELINQTLVSDNPEVTSYTWASAPSTSTIHVYESSKGGHMIQGFIKNSRITGGTVVYTITPTIKAPIMPTNGDKSVAFTSTLGDSKAFTVTIKSLAKAPSVSVAKRSIHYLEDAVFTPSSSLSSVTYHWYHSADKHKPVRNGLINRDGVLTMSKLLPGTHTFYVAVFNPNRCEGAVATISVTVKSIPVVKPPNAFTPNNDGINDVWEIPKIEQYPHCTVHVWGREKGEESVYEARDGYHEPWDGTNKQGKPLTGTYWYQIDLKDGSDEPIVGHIAIIRLVPD